MTTFATSVITHNTVCRDALNQAGNDTRRLSACATLTVAHISVPIMALTRRASFITALSLALITSACTGNDSSNGPIEAQGGTTNPGTTSTLGGNTPTTSGTGGVTVQQSLATGGATNSGGATATGGVATLGGSNAMGGVPTSGGDR